VRVYEGKCHHVMKEHTDIVSCLTISHDEKSFFSGGWDKKIIVIFHFHFHFFSFPSEILIYFNFLRDGI